MDFLKQIFNKNAGAKSQLGLFWGKDSFCISETAKGHPDKITVIPFNVTFPGDQGQKIPDSLRFTALLQQAIRDKKIISQKANLSLSIKDVIYRSFIIPFMQPQEVKNVVEFEATKYIPIKLEELAYTFHAIPFNEGEKKNLRILFVAARKAVLERYVGVLRQAGLETEFIEPSSVSLLRVLQKQGHVPKQQSTAVIEIENEGGRITIIDKDIIQFVREFQSPVEGAGTPAENSKFFNNMRVSFNFYQRQNTQAKLDRIVILSDTDLTLLAQGLGQDFKVPATALSTQKILKDQHTELGALSAYGASIRDSSFSTKNFDLSIKTIRAGTAPVETSGTFANWNFKNLGLGVGISIILFFGTTFLTKSLLTKDKAQYNTLKNQLGIYESSTQSIIEELKNTTTTKLNQYQDIRLTSDLTYYLKKIPRFFPKGAWLNNLSIEYYESSINTETGPRRADKVAIGMEGYVYLPDFNKQIRQVNNLVDNIKSDKEFSGKFNEIFLSTVRQDTLNNFPVTYFRINCK